MLSAVKRYKLLVSSALARCFPRTSAYVQSEEELILRRWPDGRKPSSGKPGKALAKPVKTVKSVKKVKSVKAPQGRQATAKPRVQTRKAKSSADDGLYGPARMAVDTQQIEAMRLRVGRAVEAGVVRAPSDEQWRMILDDSPVTRIFAGAGSGKSTTLVLRVVFMLCHLNVPPERLTVISFTNASCAELRDQLVRVLGFWNVDFDPAHARQCVRTFHSAMAALAKVSLGKPQWFEQLDQKGASPSEPDNPLASARLGAAQQRLLKQAYQACYDEQEDFRARVHQLLSLPAPEACGQARRTAPKAPLDAFKLAGEFASVPLFEAFYAQAGFIESIGIRIEQMQIQRLECSERERWFVEALVLFWRYFQATLQAQGLMTFNGAFQRLTEQLAAGSPDVTKDALAPFSHLLIDEFQDISPQIVQWLQALHGALVRQGETVSLMAIGDDWQSIYGWRGSSPELFMDFDKYFPGKGASKQSRVLMLETNYRSIEPIIRDGEAVLEGVEFKQAKTSNAAKAAQPGDHGVKLVTRFDVKAGLPALIAEIETQCRHVSARPDADRNAVLLLSRRNEPLRAIQAELDKRLPVKACTIHRAKGLQAEVAIIVDDCLPVEKHPLRNALYAYSGFFRNGYDQAMADENLRLAYVAITRGVSRVFWYTQKAQGATRLLLARKKTR